LFIGTSTAGIFKSTNNGNSWIEKNNGLTTSNVISIAINDNDVIFAGTFNAGIFRSTDSGENWIAINTGLTLLNIRDFAINNDSGFIFACSGPSPFAGKVFRSTNNGDSWTLASVGLPFGAIFSLGIDSSNNIYAGSGFGAGVYISTNNGDNWTATGLTNVSVLSLTIDKLNNIIYVGTYTDVLKSTDSGQSWSYTGALGNIWALSTTVAGEVFAGTWAGSIYRSSDSGSSWVNLINELTIVQDILITQSGDILAGTLGPGVFYSSDDGNHWENKSAGIDVLNINSVHIAPNGNIFTGSGMVYRSTDNGTNWLAVKGGRGNSWYSSIKSNSAGVIFAANAGLSGGYWIYRSTDNGDNWIRINNGLTDSTIWTIALDSLENLFIGTQAGIFKSTNDGDNWANIGLTSNKIHALAIKDNNTFFAGTGPTGIFRSTNGGNSWEQVLNIPQNVYSLTIDSVGNIFAGGYDGEYGVYRSTDNGANWVAVNSGISDLYIRSLTSIGNDIYVGTQTGGIFKTTDSGESWVSFNEGFGTMNEIFSLEIADNYIYAGTKGLWSRILYGTAPSAPTNLIAVADTFSVDLSWNDNSDSELGFKIERKDDSLHLPAPWILIDSVGANITTYTNTGLTPNTVYSYRVYAYNEFGNSAYSDSVETTTIVPVELTSFTAAANGNVVELNWSTATELNNQGFEIERKSINNNFEKIGYVAGFGTTTELKSYSFIDENVTTGTYTYRLKQIDYDGTFEYSNEVEVEISTPKEFSLNQNYPNPFNPSTKISFNLATDSKVTLKVFDVLGQEVKTLINGNITAGIHNVEFGAERLNSGVYFYRIEAKGIDGSSFTSVRKMILTK
jgi:photosystem II stability/assembly factor-like uncharacterized protein